jgi:hypothetical protein
MGGEIPTLAIDTVVAITISSVFLLALLVGFSVLFNFPKLRRSGGGTLTVRNLDESLGKSAEFLPPTAPRGPADQLATPELMEVAARKSQ